MSLNRVAAIAALAAVLTPCTVAADLETRALLDGKLEILVPADFQPMDEEMLELKYPSANRPTLVLTNEPGSFNVAVNYLADRISDSQLPDAHQAFDQMFRQMYPDAQWSRSEVTSINDRACIVLELVTPAVDTEIHNFMVAMPLEGRILVIAVNLTKELEGEWLDTAREMVNSIMLK